MHELWQYGIRSGRLWYWGTGRSVVQIQQQMLWQKKGDKVKVNRRTGMVLKREGSDNRTLFFLIMGVI